MIVEYLKEYSDIFEELLKISKQYSIDRPYIFGGVVRDHLFGIKKIDKDIDFTTNSNECIRLGIIFSSNKKASFKVFEDKHIRVFYNSQSLDFSTGILTNFNPGVNTKDWMLQNMPDKAEFTETYSRDFTINSMHQDFETGEVFDPTGLGMSDVESKILRTPLAPEITIKNDPRRIFRAIRLSSQFGLSIESSIIDYVRENSEIILNQKLTTGYMTNEINAAIEANPDLAISNIFDLGLFKLIPLSGRYSDYLIKNKLLSKYLS